MSSTVLIVPALEKGQTYPGDIKPGSYNWADLIGLLRRHKDNPAAIQFLADMME